MSDFRALSDSVLASPQIELDDIAAAKALGATLIVNNRPDGEDRVGLQPKVLGEVLLDELGSRQRRRLHRRAIDVLGDNAEQEPGVLGDHHHALTEVDAAPEGDAYFPSFDRSAFRETFREAHEAGERDEFAFQFVDLERVADR